MADMSDTFKDRLRATRKRQMLHTVGPFVGVLHEEGPYCGRGGCKEYREGVDGAIIEHYPTDDGEDDE